MVLIDRKNQGISDLDHDVCVCCRGPLGQLLIAVADPVGLEVWNRLHPDDERASLIYCSIGCAFASGLQLGRRWALSEQPAAAAAAAAAGALMPTCPKCLSNANVSPCVRVPAFKCAHCDQIFRLTGQLVTR